MQKTIASILVSFALSACGGDERTAARPQYATEPATAPQARQDDSDSERFDEARAGAPAPADHAIEGSGTPGVTPSAREALGRRSDRTRQGTGAIDSLNEDESDEESGIGDTGATGTITER